MLSRRDVLLVGATALAVSSPFASAQTLIKRPVRIISPWPVGGVIDTALRPLAAELQKRWDQPVVIETKPGASGILAAEFSARSAPDGLTLYLGDESALTLNPALNKSLSYDPVKDFDPVLALYSTVSVATVAASLPVRNLKELVAYAKENPGNINYGSFGIGSKNHLDTEVMCEALDIKMTHVPYKGMADINSALLRGEIQFTFGGVGGVKSSIEKGLLRALFVLNDKRIAALPNVPTIVEDGGPPLQSSGWFGLFVPATTPAAIVERIASDVATISADPIFREKFITGLGLEPFALDQRALRELMAKGTAHYGDVVRKLKIKLE